MNDAIQKSLERQALEAVQAKIAEAWQYGACLAEYCDQKYGEKPREH